MDNELKKCLSGEWYDCHAPVFIEFKKKTHRLLLRYNALPYESRAERLAVLKEMLGSIGEKVSIGNPFVCDYGCNIHIGNNVSINTGCTLVDCNRITIGNNVLIGPNVQIYTATHPVELEKALNMADFYSSDIEVVINGKAEKVSCQDVQFHPVSDMPIHVDFLRK